MTWNSFVAFPLSEDKQNIVRPWCGFDLIGALQLLSSNLARPWLYDEVREGVSIGAEIQFRSGIVLLAIWKYYIVNGIERSTVILYSLFAPVLIIYNSFLYPPP